MPLSIGCDTSGLLAVHKTLLTIQDCLKETSLWDQSCRFLPLIGHVSADDLFLLSPINKSRFVSTFHDIPRVTLWKKSISAKMGGQS